MSGRGVTIDLIGADDLRRALSKARTEVNTGARKTITKRALVIQRDVKRKLSKGGTGNKYRRGSKWHTASAPGQPPAVDTGRYRGSIAVTFYRGGWSAEVGTRLEPYPAFLEPPPIGNDRGLSDRPAMTPVWEEQREAYLHDMENIVLQITKG